jgi:cytochrome P450
MSKAAKAVEAGKFLGGVYLQRVQILYSARVRGDLFSRLIYPGDRTDPYEIYEQMRALGPMLPTRLGNYTTTSYPISHEVLRSRNFGVTPVDGEDIAHNDLLDLSLLQLNPPDHTRLRRLAAPAFTPRRMDGYRVLVESAINRLLDSAANEGKFDVMAGYAAPLPITVMTKLLGLPDDSEKFRWIGSTIARALDGVWSLKQARTLAGADAELREVFDELLVRRAVEPGDDLVSALVVEQGDKITAAELGPLVRLLLIAGFETTVNAIGSGVRWLLNDRDQWELLVKEPERAPAVAEEVLRFEPPVQQAVRVALTETEVAGFPIRKNQWIIPVLAAANRDPEVYPEPNRFDITRQSPAEHLAFSGGIHYCLGSPLARMELTMALRSLAERFPDLRPAGPVEMRPGTTLRGPLHVPVKIN